MATLRDKRTKPPRGYNYRQQETALEIEGDSLDELVERVIAHRAYKGLLPRDPGTVQLEIERQICTRLGLHECRPEAGDNWTPIKDRVGIPSPMGILAMSKAALDWIRGGGGFVAREESERRAAICRSCPANRPMTGCKCSALFRVVDGLVPADRRLPGIGLCLSCGCTLTVKVNVPLEILRKADEGRDIQYVSGCWMRE